MKEPAKAMIVRAREGEDVDALVAILLGTHEADGYPMWQKNVSREWLYDPEFEAAWVALAGEDVVGHVAVKRGFASPEVSGALGREASGILGITRLFVGSAARGRGAAHALLDIVDDYAKSNDLALALDVVDGTISAIALYERRGWTRVATETAEWFAPDGSHPLVHLYICCG